MIVDPARLLRRLAADLREEERPPLTVGSLFDLAVMRIVEDGVDWRDLAPAKKEGRHAASRP